MTDNPRLGYSTPRGLEAAIKSAAQAEARARPGSPDVSSLIRQATFDRLLCRVFAEEKPLFVLKGGTSMLARIPQGRSTLDIDLLAGETSLDAAVQELVSLAERDLDDHFRFVFTKRVPLLEGENQPYLTGASVTFDAYIGLQSRGVVNIDLVVGSHMTAAPQRRSPANRLGKLSLPGVDYLLYPVVDQLSDKICATMQLVGSTGSPSTRVKDLVDLVLLAQAEQVDATQLRHALTSEMRLRLMPMIQEFAIPADWEPQYSRIRGKLATTIPETATAAAELVATMINPVLSGEILTGTWDPDALLWEDLGDS